MSRWIDAPVSSKKDALGKIAAEHPLAGRLLAQRGILDERQAQAFLDPAAYAPSSPFDFPGMEAGVERLGRAVRSGERIGVWGDFDVDGLTATAILVGALRAAGADVCYHVPVRARESHGVHRPALEEMIHGGVRLLVTCDTGIDACAEVIFAQENGVDVFVSDHHRLPERLPPARAVVNPHLLPPEHPFNTLPGAGVAYEIVAGLGEHGLAGIRAETYRDLAALAVVADVVPVLGEARWLLQRGLETLRTLPRPALQAVYDLNDLDPAHITEEHIAYLLAPRINAVGRLEDAGVLVEFFLSEKREFIETVAVKMEGLNARRRLLSQEVFESAAASIDRNPALLDTPILVLSHPAWQPGVIGIVAGRLVQTYGRPAVLISVDQQSGIGRGSARSLPGVDIAAAIARQAALLKTHGGHPGAAGFSLPAENIEDFRRSLARTVAEMTAGREIAPSLTIDGYLSLGDLTLDLAEEVELLAPFGFGNPAPIFATRHLSLLSATPIGRGQEHLKMRAEDGRGNTQEILWWQGAGQPLPGAPFDLAFSLHANTYQGRRGLQLVWVEARPSETEQIPLGEAGRLPFEIIDLRRRGDAPDALQELVDPSPEDAEIWCEGETCAALAARGLRVHKRSDLLPAKTLVVWSAPPGREVLQAAIVAVQPERVCLCPYRPSEPGEARFLRTLAGYIKSALRTQAGRVNRTTLSALTAESEAAVQLGLAWLEERGDVTISVPDPTRPEEIAVSLPEIRTVNREAAARLLKRIQAALAESAAYREFFARADPNVLF